MKFTGILNRSNKRRNEMMKRFMLMLTALIAVAFIGCTNPVGPVDTTVMVEDTTVIVEDTTVMVEDTTIIVEDTTIIVEDTTIFDSLDYYYNFVDSLCNYYTEGGIADGIYEGYKPGYKAGYSSGRSDNQYGYDFSGYHPDGYDSLYAKFYFEQWQDENCWHYGAAVDCPPLPYTLPPIITTGRWAGNDTNNVKRCYIYAFKDGYIEAFKKGWLVGYDDGFYWNEYDDSRIK